MTAGEPLGTACPLCREQAGAILGGGDQAFCLNLTCDIFIWNPLETREEMLAGMKVIDLSFLEDS